MNITDAPLPADVIYEYNEDFCTVSFYYPNDMSDYDTAEIKITSIIQSSMTDSNVYKINVKFSDSGDFENYLDYSAYTVIVYMNGDEMNILSCEQH